MKTKMPLKIFFPWLSRIQKCAESAPVKCDAMEKKPFRMLNVFDFSQGALLALVYHLSVGA
jgi:hypothetical protein